MKRWQSADTAETVTVTYSSSKLSTLAFPDGGLATASYDVVTACCPAMKGRHAPRHADAVQRQRDGHHRPDRRPAHGGLRGSHRVTRDQYGPLQTDEAYTNNALSQLHPVRRRRPGPSPP